MPAMSRPPALLLFDVDATLLLAGGASKRAYQAAGEHIFGPSFDVGPFNTAGMLDPIIYTEIAEANGLTDYQQHHDAFHEVFIQFMAEEFNSDRNQLRVLPDVADLLDQLRMRVQAPGDVTLGLVTGNFSKAVPLKLNAAGIDPDWFPVYAYGDHAPTRPDLVELALQRYEKLHGFPADPRRVVVIGDTHHDIHCAHAHGCVALAVATGRFSEQELTEAGADIVLPDLSDPAPLWAILND